MPKASPAIVAFNSGEWSPLLDGRTDLQKYGSACRTVEGFIPTVQGPARRRPGTHYVAGVKDNADQTWLVPFEFSATQGYVLEFGDGYVRFYTNRGQLNISAPSAWVTATVYAVGALVSNAGTNYYCKTAHTSGATFAGDAAKWHALTGTIYEIPSPYALADLTAADGTLALNFVQSGDVMYFCNPSYPIQKLSRVGATNWNFTEPNFEGGPFEDVNTNTSVTVYASASTGSITLTASSSIFTSAHVGALFLLESNPNITITPWEVSKAVAVNDLRRSDGNIYESQTTASTATVKPTHTEGTRSDGAVSWKYLHSGYGWVQITGYTSGTSVSATVLSYVPSAAVGAGNATYKWAFGAWGDHAGYPTHTTFFRERLVFARDTKIWMSVAADYENFAPQDGDQVTPDMAISIELSSDQINDIVWLSPGTGLLVGTVGAEFLVSEISSQEALGPANVKASRQSGYGSRGIQALKVGEATLFVQKSGRKVRSMKYSFEQDNFVAGDVTVLADHISKGGILALAYQSEPDSIVWATRADGVLLGFTMSLEQDVQCWHRQPIAGTGVVVESVAVIPSPNGDRDDLWMIVKRTINSTTKRYVEWLGEYWENGDAQEDAFYVDAGATYDGAPATVISGLGHLEGEAVTILADGATHPSRTVASGSITLQRSASVVHVGLHRRSILKTLRLEAGGGDGTAQGKTKRVTRAAVRFIDTLGGKAGPDENTLDEILFRSGSDPMNEPPPVFSGDKDVLWPSGYEGDAYLTVVQDQPLPMTVVAIYPQVVTQDR
jgi:hypothetical protein